MRVGYFVLYGLVCGLGCLPDRSVAVCGRIVDCGFDDLRVSLGLGCLEYSGFDSRLTVCVDVYSGRL